jgi:hypothetical protein
MAVVRRKHVGTAEAHSTRTRSAARDVNIFRQRLAGFFAALLASQELLNSQALRQGLNANPVSRQICGYAIRPSIIIRSRYDRGGWSKEFFVVLGRARSCIYETRLAAKVLAACSDHCSARPKLWLNTRGGVGRPSIVS